MSELNVSQMSREDLKEAAADLGIEFHNAISTEKLAERIREHLGEPAPEVTQGDDLSEAGVNYEIVINTDSVDKQPVRVGVNGHMYTILRGEKVVVPKAVVENLSNAKQKIFDPRTMANQEVLAYPFQIIREVAA